jgi:hypothetical protein
MSYLRLKIKKSELEEKLRLIKELSGIEDDLWTAIPYAKLYANSAELKEIEFVNTLIVKEMSGDIKLEFDIFKLYKKL